MSRTLLTGATGFIGRHLAPALRQAGHEVFEASSQSGDVAEDSTWSRFPQSELVVHLAGKTFVPHSWADPSAFVKCNLLGTIAALNYCKKHNARMVYLSSYLYGNPQALPIPETAPLVTTNPYALSKILAEKACQFYSDSLEIDITILRPFNVYGPGQPASFLIPTIIRQVLAGESIQVKDLEPKRDYLFISDLVDAILKAVAPKKGARIFNIGSGRSYSVAELIQIIQGIRKTDLEIISSAERRKDEIMDTVADISRAYRDLGWRPKVGLEDGLRSVLAQMSSNHPGNANVKV